MVKLLGGKLFEVRVSVTGTNVAKRIEKFSEMGIILKNVKRTNVSSVSFTVANEDFKKIKKAISTDSYRIAVISRKGPLSLLFSFRKRYALIFGLLAGIICLFVISQRVCIVRVHGTDDAENVKNIAVSNGVLDWHGKVNERIFGIEQAINESNSRIIWNTVEVKGAVADIFVKEGTDKPENEFCEKIVSAKDCVIKNLIVEKGTGTASNGQTVSKGQILIDGKTVIGENEYTTSAQGKAYASVFYMESREVPITEEVYTKTGRTTVKTEISVFGIDTASKNTVEFTNFVFDEKDVNTHFLPIKIKKITYFETEKSNIVHDTEQLKKQTETDLLNKLKSEIPKDASIYETKTTAEEKDGFLCVTTYIETIENVAIRG